VLREAQATQRKPPSRAKDAAAVMPVSLKMPVGIHAHGLGVTACTPQARPQAGSSTQRMPFTQVDYMIPVARRPGKHFRKRPSTPLSSSARKMSAFAARFFQP